MGRIEGSKKQYLLDLIKFLDSKYFNILDRNNQYFIDCTENYCAKNGDKVCINFLEKNFDRHSYNGGFPYDFEFIIGSKTLRDGVEDKLIGKKVGDNFFAELSYPDNYNDKNLAGKIVTSEIHIKSIKSEYVYERKFSNEIDQISKEMRDDASLVTISSLKNILKVLLSQRKTGLIKCMQKYEEEYFLPEFFDDRFWLIKTVIKNGVDINERDEEGNTALIEALKIKSVEYGMIELFVKEGANVNISNDLGVLPISLASTSGMVELLITAGADLKDSYMTYSSNHDNYLKQANDLNIVVLLVYAGAGINLRQHLLLLCNDVEILKFLIKSGTDVNSLNRFNQSALHEQTDPEVVEFLIDAGIDVNVCSSGFGTALHPDEDYEIFILNLHCVKLIIDAGADVNIISSYGRTPLHYQTDIEIVKLLIAAGVDVNKRDNRGETALNYAFKNGEVYNFLIANGAILGSLIK